MTGGAWLATWLLLPLVGAPLLSHGAYRRFSFVGRAILSGAAGLVALSFVQTAASLAGWRWRLLPLAILSAAGCWALRLAAGGPPPGGPLRLASGDPGRRAASLLSAMAVGVALVATLAGAAGSPDLLLFWGPKAEAFAAARTIDAGFLADSRTVLMHPYYPPLVTNLYAFSSMAAGAFSWRAAALTFPILLGALALSLPSVLRVAERPLAPSAVAASAVAALGLLGAEADIAGNADMMLLAFEALGAALLLAPRPIDRSTRLLAGILLAGAASAKVEGLPFALVAILFLLVQERRLARLPERLALLVGPTALSLGVWLAFGLGRHAFSRYGEYGSLLDLRPDRMGLVLTAIGRTVWRRGFALPYLVPLALVLSSRQSPRPLPIAVAAALTLFLTTTYLLPVARPALWIEWSASRTFSPLIVLLSLSVRGPRPRYAEAAGPPS
ncbi:MAG TPA: hypothetical protein VEG84_06560 [Thermoanaerobaculia bacterium]|nr:hypothetical protein [Thermoanaerobaculia bacterium]